MYKLVCKICGKNFKTIGHIAKAHKISSKEYYNKYFKKDNEDLCLECGKKTNFNNFNDGYYRYCSSKCSHNSKEVKEKQRQTNIKRYGVECSLQNEEIKEKAKQTNIEKYGFEYSAQNEKVREKSKQTNIKRYGVEHPSQNEKIREKQRQTNIKRYGVECPLQNEEIKEKAKQTCLKNWGVEHQFQNEEVKKKKKITYLKNYGVENPSQCSEIKDKIKQTCLEKYGVEHPSQNDIVKRKIKQTWLKNYSVEHPMQSDIVKDRIKKNNLNKYGVENILQSDIVKDKIKQTNLKKYGVKNTFQNQEIKDKIKQTNLKKYIPKIKNILNNLKLELISEYIHCKKPIKIHCKQCKNEFLTSYFNIYQGCGRCPNCFPKYKSIAETEISNYTKNLGFSVVENSKKIIPPLELDIYIPDKKIAIEYHGLYYHSEELGKDKNYHLNKLKQCEEKGILLIQIFEDEWLLKQDIVKHRLLQILNVSNSKRIHARKCVIREIDPKLKNEFLENYHLQGKDNSKIKLGAFHNEELVSVMTFSKGNIAKGSCSKEGIWELNRFCSNYDYHIPGIASKLLKYFERNYEYKQIFSYADRRWSVGNVYYKLGFSLEKETIPNYWYTKGVKRIHRFNLRKCPDEPKDIPESILRIQEGYSKIWDCGHLKFVK